MIHLTITVENTAELLATPAYGAGALLRWESSATKTGAYVEGGTVALVTGISAYVVWHAAGVVGTWYRTRISNAAGSSFSAYSAVFEGGAVTAYATFDQLLLTYRNPDAITQDDNLVARCRGALDEATADLIRELGWDYFAHPSTTWIEAGEQGATLHLHAGVVSLTLVEIDLTGAGTWTALAASDWNLAPAKLPPDRPTYTHLQLAPYGAWSWWPTHDRAVRLTGVPGHPAIPVDVAAATVASARVKLAADPTWPGAPIVPEALNEPVHAGRMPEATYRLVVAERQRFMACWV